MEKSNSILIINPNSTKSMGESILQAIPDLAFPQTKFDIFTSPSGPPSINDNETALESASICLPLLEPLLDNFDGFIVACYSVHPLVEMLKSRTPKPVIGIFEASIITSLHQIGAHQQFGIISTGKIWERLLTEGVHGFMSGVGNEYISDSGSCNRFSGVETTGLNAKELHDAPPEELSKRLNDATKRLIKSSNGGLGAICLGCAAMTELDTTIQHACVEELGQEAGSRIKIIDGVVAAVDIILGQIISNPDLSRVNFK
ncbi:Asp/Glu/hydantoin racemase [Hygrophoropsis aurantiaca]|uniref:Asp/Glu/hydantoin racemase n=1 Tax=Hygrophoropsis aurantiaca TaxID=72124 RepID=A0ACB8AND3_9AGAM|nr:Asp/Glu/hydantoin racemase [Hygrophoropsis aurantiaca]